MLSLSTSLAVGLIRSKLLKSIAMNDLAASLEHTGRVLRRSSRLLSVSNKTATVASVEHEVSVELTPTPPIPRKRKRDTKDVSQKQVPEVQTPKMSIESKRTRQAPKTKTPVTKAGDEDEFVAEALPSKAKRTRERKPSPVYIIPDVEKKETTFKGRLGASYVRGYLPKLHTMILCVKDMHV